MPNHGWTLKDSITSVGIQWTLTDPLLFLCPLHEFQQVQPDLEGCHPNGNPLEVIPTEHPIQNCGLFTQTDPLILEVSRPEFLDFLDDLFPVPGHSGGRRGPAHHLWSLSVPRWVLASINSPLNRITLQYLVDPVGG